MDEQDVTRTIQELERKVIELERTLRSMGAEGPDAASAAPQPPPHQPAPAFDAPPPPSHQPAPAFDPPPPPPHQPAPAFDAPPPPPPPPDSRQPGTPRHAGFGRIVDESLEAPVPAQRPPAAGTPASGVVQQRERPSSAPTPAAPAQVSPVSAPAPSGSATQPVPPPRAQVSPVPQAPHPSAPPGASPSAPPSLGHAAEARMPPPPRAATAAPSPLLPSPAELLRFRERLERTARDLTDDYDELLGRISYGSMATTAAAPSISFARGAPSLDIVDVQGLKEAAARAFESDPAGTTAYGTAIGYPRLRSWIADRHGVEPERVLVTNGSMQADAFLFEALVGPGDDVVVERPTYDRTLLSLRSRGAQLHAVQLQPDGIDTAALESLLADGARPKLAHIIPNFQNPAGYTLSLAKRARLLELAASSGFLIFEDDPYVSLRFSGEDVPTMLSMDPERVVYASSFSKTVCPGIRVGYLVGPTDLIADITKLATNTYISPNMVAQSIVYEFCASGAIERSIETVSHALAERARTLAEALRRELPEAEFVPPMGGYFMWVTLPEGTDVARLFELAAERGVAFVKGTDFLLEGGENTLRLAYSGVTPEQIETGVQRLAEAYRSL